MSLLLLFADGPELVVLPVVHFGVVTMVPESVGEVTMVPESVGEVVMVPESLGEVVIED